MKKIFGIVGWSGSGKTDLICRLIEAFRKKNFSVGSIKHTHHNFEIDKKGKDSFKHISSGSEEVILYNEKKYAMVSNFLKEKIMFSIKQFFFSRSFISVFQCTNIVSICITNGQVYIILNTGCNRWMLNFHLLISA